MNTDLGPNLLSAIRGYVRATDSLELARTLGGEPDDELWNASERAANTLCLELEKWHLNQNMRQQPPTIQNTIRARFARTLQRAGFGK